LDRGPFGREVDAALVFFYTGPRMQLCWKLAVALPDLREQYLLLVDAERPFADVTSVDDAVLLCQRTTCAAMANVYLHNPGAGSRELVELPLVADTYPLNGTGLALPHPFPAAWWVDHDRTVGNCALTVQAVTASSFVGRIDSDAVLFDPAEADGDEQQLLNAFFFCNYMHDFFYMLGFSEAEGNFQKINFTNGGAANDAVVARVHPNRIPKTATFTTPADGVAPTMNLGAVSLPDGTVRHTALDSDVVFHEYVHGVTTRLVGGRMTSLPLQEPQSKAMGEGWGDYFALTIQNHGKAVEKVVTGDWITGRPAGTRSAPYDEQYPNTYGHIGVAPFNAEHHIGEIWCATLMQMNRNLDSAIGAPRGHQLGWQVVVDGLKLTPANPSFLDGRDAILKALEDLGREGRISVEDFTAARRAAWRAFAHFGLGAMASSNGASLHGIVEDRTVPDSI
jgi:extracellular elastinolytic metalloproteinase